MFEGSTLARTRYTIVLLLHHNYQKQAFIFSKNQTEFESATAFKCYTKWNLLLYTWIFMYVCSAFPFDQMSKMYLTWTAIPSMVHFMRCIQKYSSGNTNKRWHQRRSKCYRYLCRIGAVTCRSFLRFSTSFFSYFYFRYSTSPLSQTPEVHLRNIKSDLMSYWVARSELPSAYCSKVLPTRLPTSVPSVCLQIWYSCHIWRDNSHRQTVLSSLLL